MSPPTNAPLSRYVVDDVERYLRSLPADLPPTDAALHDALMHSALERGFPWVGAHSGRWLELLTRMIGGRRVFELGSGFGYSAFWFARAVGEGGQVLGSEKDAWEHEHFDRLWGDHALRGRVSIAHDGAFEALAATTGAFDVVFCDIGKADYPRALDLALPRLRVGGLFLADNTLWGGRATKPAAPDDDSGTDALRAFNERIHADPRLQSLILPVGDGLSVTLRVA
ncbi:MAG: O-methyltransferase [Alphaproteobacteria bacterium]|nr:O-methyltransferase [Alphaproteobacteria bacterium]